MRNKAAVIHHSHHQQRHMPAAGDKPAVGRSARVLFVNVKRVRIPHFGELNDLVACDHNLPEIEYLAHLVILGISRRFFDHDCRFAKRGADGAGPIQSDPASHIISIKALEDAMTSTATRH